MENKGLVVYSHLFVSLDCSCGFYGTLGDTPIVELLEIRKKQMVDFLKNSHKISHPKCREEPKITVITQ